ncbi:unnamed protein product [Rhodiola kirilowii]
MGRGKIVIERINNTTSRQVTFSKRRKGLLKKARELSILCDVQVGVMIFSSTGKLYEFASNSSIKDTIEQYKKLKGDQPRPVSPCSEVKHLKNEASTLQHQLPTLQHQLHSVLDDQRKVLGEQLSILTIQELQHLENQLEMNIKCIRMKKDEIMLAELEELRHKGSLLHQENCNLHNEAAFLVKNRQVYSVRDPNEVMTTSLHTDELRREDIPVHVQLQLSLPQPRNTELASRNCIMWVGLKFRRYVTGIGYAIMAGEHMTHI